MKKKRREVANKLANPLLRGTLVMARLTPLEKAAYPSKLVPLYKGPWVIREYFANEKTSRLGI